MPLTFPRHQRSAEQSVSVQWLCTSLTPCWSVAKRFGLSTRSWLQWAKPPLDSPCLTNGHRQQEVPNSNLWMNHSYLTAMSLEWWSGETILTFPHHSMQWLKNIITWLSRHPVDSVIFSAWKSRAHPCNSPAPTSIFLHGSIIPISAIVHNTIWGFP